MSPQSGDQSAAEFGWYLEARLIDPEEGLLANPGTWTSSLDGELGAGATLGGVALSPGSHLLTYSVTDGSGLPGSAATSVVVLAAGNAPVALGADALQIAIPGEDRYAQPWQPLKIGESHRATLKLRTQGEDATFRLCLFLTAPGQSETIIGESIAALPPFGSAILEATFTPTSAGAYSLRATLERGIPDDPESPSPVWAWVPESDRAWSLDTGANAAVAITNVGSGSVVIAPDGIVCGPAYLGSFARGRSLLLLAQPSPGWRFDGWEGAAPAESPNAAAIIAGGLGEVVARFVQVPPASTGSLAVRLNDAIPGGGAMDWRIVGTPDWIDAGAARSGLPEGSYLIEFRNIPGYPDAPPQLVELPGSGAVTYTHTVPAYAVELEADPSEGGTLTGAGSYLPGTEISLFAEPAQNYLFTGWFEGGLLVSGSPSLSFTADRHRKLAATFLYSIQLSSAADLQMIGNDPAFPANGTYHLAGDLDASETQSWNGGQGFQPIANFTGSFDGRGYSISGMHIDRPGANGIGLFGSLGGGAEIKNLTLTNAYVRGDSYIGALTGDGFSAVIEDCAVEAMVVGNNYVGTW
ncbi:MAG: hypothetical protein R3F11_25625 [Verrucomicrobiales bacterium]